MPLVSLFALALMAAEPTAPAPAKAPPPTAGKAPAASALVEEPVPAGAPADDYGLVNWCAGALSGHMVLYHDVKAELDRLPDAAPKETAALDADQIKAGRDYLTLYKRAIDAAERASPRAIADRGLTLRRQGNAIWTPARNAADSKTRMWTWLSWELPGRCETAAERLYEKSLLSAQALGIDIVNGSSAASNKPVTPQLEAPSAQKGTVQKQPLVKTPARKSSSDDEDITIAGLAPATSQSASGAKASGSGVAGKGAQASGRTQVAAAAPPPSNLPIEEQFQAEIDGKSQQRLAQAAPAPAPPRPLTARAKAEAEAEAKAAAAAKASQFTADAEAAYQAQAQGKPLPPAPTSNSEVIQTQH